MRAKKPAPSVPTPAPPPVPPPTWRERIATVANGIGRALAYREALKGSLPTFRVGRRLLVGVAALERLLGEAID